MIQDTLWNSAADSIGWMGGGGGDGGRGWGMETWGMSSREIIFRVLELKSQLDGH